MSSSVSSIFTMPVLPNVRPGDFEIAARLLQKRAGIVLGNHKREMVSRTLSLRAKKLGVHGVTDYLSHLEQNAQSDEWSGFINAFTINHTAFFREAHHFQTLVDFVRGRRAPVSVWCSAASTGEEAYTIAMVLHKAQTPGQSPASVWATDIDTNAITHASNGIYSLERAKPVPDDYLKKYFDRGQGRHAGMTRIKPLIRDLIRFDALNLLSPNWPTDKKFDAIFCRNTMIYFDKATQTRVLERFALMLKPAGLLFVGHSENVSYLTDAFRLRGQTVYVRAH